jgi:hypothetical protein
MVNIIDIRLDFLDGAEPALLKAQPDSRHKVHNKPKTNFLQKLYRYSHELVEHVVIAGCLWHFVYYARMYDRSCIASNRITRLSTTTKATRNRSKSPATLLCFKSMKFITFYYHSKKCISMAESLHAAGFCRTSHGLTWRGGP